MSIHPLNMSSNRVRSFSANTPAEIPLSKSPRLDSPISVSSPDEASESNARLTQLTKDIEEEAVPESDPRYENPVFNLLRSIRCTLFSTIGGFVLAMALCVTLLLCLFFISVTGIADTQHQSQFSVLYSLVLSQVTVPKLVTDAALSALDLSGIPQQDKTKMKRFAWYIFNRSNRNLNSQLWFFRIDDNSGNSAGYYGVSDISQSYIGFVRGFNETIGNVVNTYELANLTNGEFGAFQSSGEYPDSVDFNSQATQKRATWTQPYAMCVPQCYTFVPYVRPFVDPTTSTPSFFARYVFSTDYLSTVMNEITPSNAISYIYDAKTLKMIASSSLTHSKTGPANANASAEILTVTQYDHQLVHESSSVVQEYLATSNTSDRVYVKGRPGGPSNLQLAFQRYTDPKVSGLEWIVVYYIPVMTNLGSYIYSGIAFAIFSSFLLIVAAVLGNVFAYIITKPLLHLADEMALVENMDLNAIQTGVFHYFSEILSMQSSFYMMIAKLKEYRTYLPSHLLNTGHHDDDDDEEEGDINGLGHIGSDSSRSMVRHTSLRSRSSSTSSQGKSFFGNRKQSTVSGSSGGGSNHNRPNTANDVRFSLGLESRDVTIAIVRIVNQDSLMYKMENSDFVFVHGCLTKEIMQISKRFKGDLHDFNASEFIIHWNTIIRQKAHCKQACGAVLAIKDAIEKLNDMQMKDGLPEISCTIGVASGSATIGNMGTQQKRKFVAFGQTEQLARGLDQLNIMWGTKILVNEKVFHSASKFFTMRPLDEMVISKKPKQIVSLAYELADEVKNEADEWMYEMQHKEKSNRYENFIQAFSLYQNRDLNNALKFLNQFIESNPLDMPSQKLKSRWQQLKTETKQDTQKTGIVRSLLTTSVIEEEYM